MVEYDREQVDLIKRMICKDASDDELQLFIQQCKRTGLDPFNRQIHAVKRWDSQTKRNVMTVQVGIDGFRLIAERTDRYVPGREPTFTYDREGNLVSATSYVKKLAGGAWHEVSATAFFREYVQTTKEGVPNRFWARMPCTMLAKCAEALALRRAFPMELSGLYAPEEMAQADVEVEVAPTPVVKQLPAPEVKPEQPPLSEHINPVFEECRQVCKHYQVPEKAFKSAVRECLGKHKDTGHFDTRMRDWCYSVLLTGRQLLNHLLSLGAKLEAEGLMEKDELGDSISDAIADNEMPSNPEEWSEKDKAYLLSVARDAENVARGAGAEKVEA